MSWLKSDTEGSKTAHREIRGKSDNSSIVRDPLWKSLLRTLDMSGGSHTRQIAQTRVARAIYQVLSDLENEITTASLGAIDQVLSRTNECQLSDMKALRRVVESNWDEVSALNDAGTSWKSSKRNVPKGARTI